MIRYKYKSEMTIFIQVYTMLLQLVEQYNQRSS